MGAVGGRRSTRAAPALLVLAVLLATTCADDGVVVLLGGDVHGEPPVTEALVAGRALAGVRDELASADLVVVNLETPVAPGGEPADKAIVFRADVTLLDALVTGGVDVVSLANNHALDHGPAVLAATVAAAAARGLAVVGAGPDDAAAWAPAVFERRGRRIAVLGMTDVVPGPDWPAGPGWGVASALDHDRAAAAVAAAGQMADHVVVSVHWGNELRDCPSVVQTELARRLVAAGADVVAGHHPHVVQGVEERDGAAVAYSVGNLLFYAATPETRDAALLRATLSPAGLAEHRLVPLVLGDDGAPDLAVGADAGRITERVRHRSPGGGTCPAQVWDGLPGRRDVRAGAAAAGP